MQKIKGVIFDMDGVIVDSEPLHVEAESQIFKKYGVIPTSDDWLSFKGRTSVDIFSSMIRKYNLQNISGEHLAEEKIETYIEIINKSELKLFEGFIDLIKYLKPKYSLALATSSTHVIKEAVFNRFNLHKYFYVTVTGDMVKRGKPDPEAYIMAISKMGLNPSECVVIEDSDNGVISGKGAGAYTIAVTHTFPKERLTLADKIVDSLDEIQKFL